MFQTEAVEVKKTHFGSITFFSENHAVYEIMGKNIAEWGRQQMAIWRIACRIT